MGNGSDAESESNFSDTFSISGNKMEEDMI